ncbi:TIGR01777 family oxidoreductase [Nocardioides marmorisolisilvae]|uniref:TIGR01777 family protein n=1 Tax=Nocardioides marmorisolisilvae TaxID=1542737 RepID=A0A3N0DTT6_9ACTN|nr:TIGR01777 family oxidoreductase [Nocardioides marmorisolisilvae]RNL79032.1 TIGR01777 family protein [Nocardioides marmorisolisilvae]
MHFLIAGASGFLGSHLTASLRTAGHEVTTLSRSGAGAEAVTWDPYAGPLDPAVVDKADVVVNLAGSPTAGNPHSPKWARELRKSRVTTTRVLAEAIAASATKPAFLAGNAIAIYGDHGEETVNEADDSRGSSFLTEVTLEWKAATQPAVDAGARVAVLHTVPVMDRRSAPLKQLRLLFKTGLGGRIGSGQQYMPMISLRDWVAAATFVAEHEEIAGPVNLCCASTPTNAQFTSELAGLLHRPALAPVPAIVLKQAAGKLAPELLGSIRAVPEKLLSAGFRFADPDVGSVLRTGLGVGS